MSHSTSIQERNLITRAENIYQFEFSFVCLHILCAVLFKMSITIKHTGQTQKATQRYKYYSFFLGEEKSYLHI